MSIFLYAAHLRVGCVKLGAPPRSWSYDGQGRYRMAVRDSKPSSGERLLLFLFVAMVVLAAARWVISFRAHP